MRALRCIGFVFILLCGQHVCAQFAHKDSSKQAVHAQRQLVVSASPEASRIGLQILQAGGNAFDAQVAVEFALAVSFPWAGNIAGGGMAMLCTGQGQLMALDYREVAPAAATRTMFLDSAGQVLPHASLYTARASGVPGTVAGMWSLHQKLGSLRWAQLVLPAAQLARQGFVLSTRMAANLNEYKKDFLRYNPGHPVPFVRADGRPWQAADTLRQPELAATLERIAQHGAHDFYAGQTAQLLLDYMQRQGGLITRQDLQRYQPVWRQPLQCRFRGHVVSSVPPPSSSIALLQILQMIDPYQPEQYAPGSTQQVQLLTEAMRRAYADRAHYLGDADQVRVPVQQLLDSNYIAQRMHDFNWAQAGSSAQTTHGQIAESDETTHYCIMDAAGNAVSATTTLNGGYGSRRVVPGTGMLLNNQMDDFAAKPGAPNLYGLVGSAANAIAPGKRMLSSMSPTIVLRAGKPVLLLGAPGGSRIITAVAQTLLNVLLYGMNAQDAVAQPRFHHQWLPDEIQIEVDALTPAVRAALQQKGYPLKVERYFCRVNVIRRLPDGSLEGGADPRGDDVALGE